MIKESSLADTPNVEALLQRWLRLVNEFAADGDVALDVFQDIVVHYSEPQRAYHTLLHLQCLFTDLDAVWGFIGDADKAAVEFAAWFHDVIYQPGRGDNEAMSAQLACQSMERLGVDSETIERAALMIDATKHHTTDVEDAALQLFLDADMAILGYPPTRYQAYVGQVRKEFQHTPPSLFQQGRKHFITTTLAMSRIYGSDQFFTKFEQQARSNLQWELEHLQ